MADLTPNVPYVFRSTETDHAYVFEVVILQENTTVKNFNYKGHTKDGFELCTFTLSRCEGNYGLWGKTFKMPKSTARNLKRQEQTLVQVTRREREVLKLLAEGLTTHEISERLFISTHTVDSHRKNLLSKFGVRNTTSLLHKALG